MEIKNQFGCWTFVSEKGILTINTPAMSCQVGPYDWKQIGQLMRKTKLVQITNGGQDGIVQAYSVPHLTVEQVEYECGDDYVFIVKFPTVSIAFLADWEVRRLGEYLQKL